MVAAETPIDTSGRQEQATLFGAAEEARFFRDVWQQQPSPVPTPVGIATPTIDEIEHLLVHSLAPSNIVLARTTDDGVERQPCPATRNDRVDRYELFRLYAAGWTIVANGVSSRSDALASIAARFEARLDVAFAINVYLTPEGSQGFGPHADSHDVFIVGVAGAKRWDIYDHAIDRPIAGMTAHDSPPPITASYKVGRHDCLYIPRGWRHRAVAEGDATAHLTIGCRGLHRLDAVRRLAARAAERDPRLRELLSASDIQSFDGDAATELVSLLAASAEAVASEVAADLYLDHLDSLSPPPATMLGANNAAASLTLATRLAHRSPTAAPAVTSSTNQAGIRSHTNEVRGPVALHAAFDFIARTPSFAVDELPDPLSDESRLVLARRLLREGIVTIETDAHTKEQP